MKEENSTGTRKTMSEFIIQRIDAAPVVAMVIGIAVGIVLLIIYAIFLVYMLKQVVFPFFQFIMYADNSGNIPGYDSAFKIKAAEVLSLPLLLICGAFPSYGKGTLGKAFNFLTSFLMILPLAMGFISTGSIRLLIATSCAILMRLINAEDNRYKV